MANPLAFIANEDAVLALSTISLVAFIPLSAAVMRIYQRNRRISRFERLIVDHGLQQTLAARGINVPAPAGAVYNRDTAPTSAFFSAWVPAILATLICLLGAIVLVYGSSLFGLCTSAGTACGKSILVLAGGTPLNDPNLCAYQQFTVTVIAFAFAGAYLWSLQILFRRMVSEDLRPSVYYNLALRIVLAVLVAVVLRHSLSFVTTGTDQSNGWLPAIAFFTGMMPYEVLRWLAVRTPIIKEAMYRNGDSLPLEAIVGISNATRDRLEELLIDDVENLANVNPLEVVVNSPFRPNEIVDWIGQAQLMTQFGQERFGILKDLGIRTSLQFVCCAADPARFQALVDDAKDKLSENLLRRSADCLSTDASFKRLKELHDHLTAALAPPAIAAPGVPDTAPPDEDASPPPPQPEPETTPPPQADPAPGS